MRFFGFGKKRAPKTAQTPVPPANREEGLPTAPTLREIVVYGTGDGARCRQLRGLLERRGYDYKDVRVDEDLSMCSWLQRTTGDDSLPKVFVGTTCYGGFEDMQVRVFDGSLDRILHGESDQDGTVDELAALKEEMSAAAIHTLLRKGEILIIKEGEMEMEAWAEPLANPPLVYYEGTPHPVDEIESIAQQIVMRLNAGEIEASWKEDD
jgi:glutaredoxin 3